MFLKKKAKEFCLNTYAHGFKLIVLPKRSLFERIIWVAITGISITAALSLSWIAWVEIRDAPTITLTDSPHYPIWNYPFPAITVCNFNTISRKRAYQTAQCLTKPQNVTVEKLAWDLRLLYHLIDATYPEIPHRVFTTLQSILDENDVLIEELMRYLAPTCKEMMQRCTWKGQQIPCDKLFEQIKTPTGFCCSFNYFALKNHTFGGLRTAFSNYKIHTKPRRVAATGYQTALEAVINSLPEDYFATPFASIGHKVVIHYPYNFPDGNALTMFQSTKGLIFVGIKPSLFRTDDKVENLAVSERKCLFRREGTLINFEYTYYNCMSECRANITKELCGCIPFYYYYSGTNNNGSYGKSRVCNLEDIFCLSENKQKIQTSIPGRMENPGAYIYRPEWPRNNGKCPCLPDCRYCTYEAEATSGEFNKEYAGNKPTLFGGVKLVNQSVFRIFFDDLVSVRYTTSVKYYWHTILGLFGGVLGFFTGFSIVSLIEMAYFFTIRPILDFIVQKKTTETNKTKITFMK